MLTTILLSKYGGMVPRVWLSSWARQILDSGQVEISGWNKIRAMLSDTVKAALEHLYKKTPIPTRVRYSLEPRNPVHDRIVVPGTITLHRWIVTCPGLESGPANGPAGSWTYKITAVLTSFGNVFHSCVSWAVEDDTSSRSARLQGTSCRFETQLLVE